MNVSAGFPHVNDGDEPASEPAASLGYENS